MNTLVQKALSAGITLVGGIVGSRVVAGGWRLVTGHSAPDDAADETLPLVEALSFAFISAGVAALPKSACQPGAAAAIPKVPEPPAPRVHRQACS
ncbi:DUF4235 domain-containing protein, partial [Micrococcus sp. HSID17228]|uniref:DUF4235 domain-containing protein n=1 Tax=Micrococcus sp. HSID17228 TaxID=2419507 RepID=UPI000FB95640